MSEIKPYTLRLFQSVLGTQGFVLSLTELAQNWRRSIRNTGGYWRGSFTITGKPEQLKEWFDTWMGHHLEERTDNTITWEGLIYQMDLRYAGITRRRSFDLMANAVNCMHSDQGYDTDNNLVDNGGFEFYSEAADVTDFDSWVEGVGDADLNVDAGPANTGSAGLKLTSDGTYNEENYHSDVYCRQNINVSPGVMYNLRVYSYSAGLYGGRVGVRDPNKDHWLAHCSPQFPNAYAGAAYAQREWFFPGPSNKEVLIYLYPGKTNDTIYYFDDVALYEYGDIISEAGWAVIDGTNAISPDSADSPSINKFGRKEEMLLLDNYPEDTAIAYRDAVLRQYNLPTSRTASISRKGEAQLDVTVAGYVATMNWMYERAGDGSNDDLSDWMKDIVGTDFGLSEAHGGTSTTAGDCQFVKYIGSTINTNALKVNKKSTINTRAWDTIRELIAIGIEDPNDAGEYIPARGWVDTGRIFRYEAQSQTPVKFITDKGIFNQLGDSTAATPWHIRPGVFRDYTYPSRRETPDSFLDREQDILVEEVEVKGDGTVLLKTGLFAEEDLYEAQAQFMPVEEEPARQLILGDK